MKKSKKEKLFDRFLKCVTPEPNTGCWLWTASLAKDGYGQLYSSEYRFYRAHRVSYFLFNGEFDRNLYVCHSCDTPSCVNPDHLFLGTPKQNMEDRDKKWRVMHGTKHHSSVLDAEKVRNIRIELSKHKSERGSYELIGKKYGVSGFAIYNIKRGKTWNHVN